MTTQLGAKDSKSYFVFNEEPKAVEMEVQFEGDPLRSTSLSQGEIEFFLTGEDVVAFSDRPVDYIKRAILATGRKANAIRVEDRSREPAKERAAARAWAAVYCKCTWVHIDEPPEHESTWICIKLPSQMLTPFA